MKRFYTRFRIMLMTFALGLASVFMSNGSLNYSNEIIVELPKSQSESPIIVFSIEEKFIPYCDGSIGKKVENAKYCFIVITQAKD
ncbi:MAG TPA: hypothetical protein VNI84_05725 [Pyrinomonadaceae bacterium]|nr:hypothetical protein [Pyrinomonadaceae bacterium]